MRVKVVKNKVAPPFRQAEFDIEFGKGVSKAGSLIDLGIDHNVVGKSGSFFSYGDTRLGQGRNNAKNFLDENPDIAQAIQNEIYRAVGIDPNGGRSPSRSTTTSRRWIRTAGPPRLRLQPALSRRVGHGRPHDRCPRGEDRRDRGCWHWEEPAASVAFCGHSGS